MPLDVGRVARAAAFGLVAVLLGACGFRTGYDDLVPDATTVTAGPDVDADEVSAVSDAGAVGDAADVAPLPAEVCGSMFLLRDGFDDGVRADVWTAIAQGGATVVEAGGHLAVQLGSGGFGAEGGYRSRMMYDVRSGAASVEVLRTGGQLTALEVRDAAGRGAAIGVLGVALVAMIVDGTIETTRTTVVHDPLAHRHWRLREAGGTLYWETSPDRATWTILHDEAVPMTGTYAHAYLLARGQLAAEAWFDDFNLPATESLGLCPASSVADTFDDGVLPVSYNAWTGNGSCTVRETGGRLELTFAGFGAIWCAVDTSQLVDLRNDAVFVEVIPAPPGTTFTTLFEAIARSGDKLQMSYGPEGLSMQVLRGNYSVARTTMAYSPVAHRFWRLRERDGHTFWDTSSDAAAWTNRFSAPTAIDVNGVVINMGAGHVWPGPGSAVVTAFDRLNSSP